MKRLRRTQYAPDMVNISADTETNQCIYRLEFRDFDDYFHGNSNQAEFLLLSKMWDMKHFDMFDWSHVYDAKLIDEVVYVTQDDGNSVLIQDTEYSKDELLEVFEPEELTGFITDGDAKTISKYFTEYEVKWDKGDIEAITTDLMNNGISFTEVVKSAQSCGLLENI